MRSEEMVREFILLKYPVRLEYAKIVPAASELGIAANMLLAALLRESIDRVCMSLSKNMTRGPLRSMTWFEVRDGVDSVSEACLPAEKPKSFIADPERWNTPV